MADLRMPPAIARTPAGRRLDLILRHALAGGAPLGAAELDRDFLTEETPGQQFSKTLELTREAIRGLRLESVRSPDPCMVTAVLANGERTCQLCVRVENQPPYRVRNILRSDDRPGFVVRRALEGDAPALRAIELHAPIVLGDTQIIYDHGDDFFATERLMEHALTVLVEHEGEAVGLCSSALNKIRVNGRELTGIYLHRLRVLPAVRGGIANMLGFASFEAHGWRADVSYSFVAVENDAVLRKVRLPGWSVQPERAVVDTSLQATAAHGRPATPEDAERIVSLLNTHEREELYVPYTVDTLAARLNRDRRQYSWPQLRVGARAVVGTLTVNIGVLRTSGGVTEENTRALVLDYGCEPGAEQELLALIGAECADLARQGVSELAIFTSPPSAAHARLTALAKRIEPYRLQVPIEPVSEPLDLAERGVYVDQLYF